MTAGRKTGGKDWEPGQSGNPDGRPKVPEYIKEAKKLNKGLLDEYMNKYINMPVEEIKEIVEGAMKGRSDTPAMEVMIARVIMQAINKGDYKTVNFILDRMVGKVKEHLEVSGNTHDKLMALIESRKGK